MTFPGKYPDYQALAKLEYGRLLWKSPAGRQLLLSNWLNPQHPHSVRFEERREILEYTLSTEEDYDQLDAELRQKGSSLRATMRDIPSYFPNLT